YATLYLELVDDEEGTVVDDAENAEEHAEVEEIDFEEIGMDEDDEESDEAKREDDEPLVDFSREEFRRFLSEHATFPRSTEERIALSPADRRIIRSLYGGYVTYLDRELGRIIDAVDQLPEDKPLLIIVAAARGEALDDVTALDADGKQLADDIVHTPLFVWDVSPSRSDIGSRRQALVQTDDLVPTIAEWFGITNEKPSGNGQSLLPLVRNEKLELRSEIVLSAPGATAIRTREYYLVHSESPKPVNEPMLADAPAAQLFLKPEDIWEVNDVAGQSPGLVESLLDRLKSRTTGIESPQGTT
ncbi:MAG: sulfatase-like hydrolase/transferase, partial [Phycisphaerae bacterium]